MQCTGSFDEDNSALAYGSPVGGGGQNDGHNRWLQSGGSSRLARRLARDLARCGLEPSLLNRGEQLVQPFSVSDLRQGRLFLF